MNCSSRKALLKDSSWRMLIKNLLVSDSFLSLPHLPSSNLIEMTQKGKIHWRNKKPRAKSHLEGTRGRGKQPKLESVKTPRKGERRQSRDLSFKPLKFQESFLINNRIARKNNQNNMKFELLPPTTTSKITNPSTCKTALQTKQLWLKAPVDFKSDTVQLKQIVN
jgi:hypothetical protein